MKKSLVVYYTRSGNSKLAVDAINEKYDVDIFETKLIKDYSNVNDEYVEEVRFQLKHKISPEIYMIEYDLQDYDTIFVVTPNWGNTMAPAVRSFFSNNDIIEKNIFPIITHGGTGAGDFRTDLLNLADKCTIFQPFVYKYGNLDKTSFYQWIIKQKK